MRTRSFHAEAGTIAAGFLLLQALCSSSLAQSPFIARSPDSLKTYVCGDEYRSASGCFKHWCMSYELSSGPRKPNQNEQETLDRLDLSYSPWSPCYVHLNEGGGGSVDAGGVAWWGWGKGKLGSSFLDGFWARDYRDDKGREECGINCTVYGFAARIADNPDCYHVRENWATASPDRRPFSKTSASREGFVDVAYCVRPMVAD